MQEKLVISADSHINEPPDLWTARLPKAMRDRGPRVERFVEGDAWVIEGALDPINFGSNCSAGLPIEDRRSWITWDEVREGGYRPGARIVEQDHDGVAAEVIYPTPRVSNSLFWNNHDPAFHLACIRAYNDWLSEFCAHDPARLWGIAMLPNAGVGEAVDELGRAVALPGVRGAMIGQYPHGGETVTDDDDVLWAGVAETGVPLSIHVSFATQPQGDKGRAKFTGDMRFFDAPIRAGQFIRAGIFDRFPDLRLVLVEVDSSWLPYLKEQMDDRFERTAPSARPAIKRRPSEYFDDNIASTFITDRYGIRNRHEIGVSQMLWSSDHPHGGSDWPNSWKVIDEQFRDVPEAERHQILAGNALRLYGVSAATLVG
ncbi:MAG: amidohydrolase family protein [Acidimicrobiales bacterium]